MMAEVDAQLPTDPGGEASGAENLENIRPLSVIKKQQSMFLWNSELEKWRECLVTLAPPWLTIIEYEDLKIEVDERKLKHLTQRWFHSKSTRREARNALLDFGAGEGSFLVRSSQNHPGKFAISFIFQSRAKHAVVVTTHDPDHGCLYSISASGPYFLSLYELIEEAQKSVLIQNEAFGITLGVSPPQPHMLWLHRELMDRLEVDEVLNASDEQREGAFLVYKTRMDPTSYIVAYRSGERICHDLITYLPLPNIQAGYTLHNITSPVLYKIIHYFMENPIQQDTVLKYPVSVTNSETVYTNCGYAIKDSHTDSIRHTGELEFVRGALIRNIEKSEEWSVGDYRGDRQKRFRRDCVQLLKRNELAFLNEMKHQKDEVMAEYDTLIDPQPVLVPDTSAVQEEVSNTLQVETEIEVVPSDDCDSATTPSKDEIVPQPPANVQDVVPNIIKINIETEFEVSFPLEERSTVITIKPMETLKGTRLITYTLSFHTRKDLESWYELFRISSCSVNICKQENRSKTTKKCLLC